MLHTISAIYAISENQVLGKNNDIPWRLSDDLKMFKRTTLGKPIIMGRKTFESLGKPLPKRRNIVVSRSMPQEVEGYEVYRSLDEAITACSEPEIFIIGGAQLFQEAFDKGYIHRVYETLVHAEVEGDVFFSLPDAGMWTTTKVDSFQANEKNEFAFTLRVKEHQTRLTPVKADFGIPTPEEYAPYYASYIANAGDTPILSLLEQQQADFIWLQSMPQVFWGKSYAPGKWTAAQIVGHLTDTERVFNYRAMRIGRNDTTPLPGFHQDMFVDEGFFQLLSSTALLAGMQAVRMSTVALGRSMRANMILRVGTASDSTTSVRALFYMIAGHHIHHFKQLRTIAGE
ncbi:MAG: dihydrofolate reductase [Bacteroidota bacterium]